MQKDASPRPRWWWRLAVAVFGGVLGATVAMVVGLVCLPRTYEAKASVVFPTGPERPTLPAGLDIGISNPAGGAMPLSAYEAVLTSERALGEAGRRCGVADLYHLKSPDGVASRTRAMVSARFRVDRVLQLQTRVPGTPRLSLSGRSGGDDLAYRELAARLIPALIGQMGVIADDMALDRTKARRKALQRRLAQEMRRADELETKMVALQQALGNVELMSYAQRLSEEVVRAQRQVDEAEVELKTLQRNRQVQAMYLRKQLDSLPQLPSDLPLLQDLREVANKARTRYQRLSTMYGPDNAQVRLAKRDLEQAEAQLRAGAAMVRQGLEPNLIKVQGQIEQASSRAREGKRILAAREAQLRAMPASAVSLAQATRDHTAQREVVAKLRAELLNAELEYERSGVRWYVLDVPKVPTQRAGPRTKLLLATGLLVGTVLFSWPVVHGLIRELLEVSSGA